MRSSLCSKGYNETEAAHSSVRGNARVDWLSPLPREWRAQVVEPVEFDVFREYEVAAERSLGRDEDGLPCYYAHRYALQELRSDDDDDFYLVTAYAETMTAWRLCDGRWLALRRVCGDQGMGRAFFSVSEDAPFDRAMAR